MVQLNLLATLATMTIAVVSSPINPSIKTTRELQSLSRHDKQKQNQNQQNPKCPSPSAPPAASPASLQTAKALYFLSNTPQNEIIALKIATDGTLSPGSQTCTAGSGLTGLTADNLPATPDPLFSQSSLKVSGNTLIAVNAGSNTLSMFTIDSTDATKLTMVGTPANTLGEFPVSVAVSDKLKLACVANSGAVAGVACFSMDAASGLKALDTALRPVELGQTTPPVGPTNTISHVFFNADESALLMTVKGDPAVNKTGSLSVFPIVNGVVSTQDIGSSPDGTAVLFGSVAIPGTNNVFVTDASFGAATISLPSSNSTASKSQILAKTPIANQAATCWAAISPLTKTAFITDVAVNHLIEIDPSSGKILGTLDSVNGNAGMIDLVAAGGFVYALAATKGDAEGKGIEARVAVFEVGGGGVMKEIQNFSPAGITGTAQGLTFA